MRQKLIVGNWKMNKDIHETADLVSELKKRIPNVPSNVSVVICPPFTSLVVARELIADTQIKLGAQNVCNQDDGAFTGEISSRMLTAVGCEYVIVGHSERRQYFKETNEVINAKARKALQFGLHPIVCIGETLEEREKGVTDQIITAQVRGVLKDVDSQMMENLTIAYEPVWAIGTGRNATPDQANQVHRLVRRLVGQLFSWQVAERVPILYGGSVNPANAADLLSESDIDGALVGGASLKADAFAAIFDTAVGIIRKE